jgi:hypothetical protein
MRMSKLKIVGRITLALCAAGSLQACATLSTVHVATLPSENSSAERSMLSLYNPLAFQHRSLYEGMLLRSPQDRNPKYVYLGY